MLFVKVLYNYLRKTFKILYHPIMRLLMSSDKLCPSFDPCCFCSFKRENGFIYLIIHAKDEEFYICDDEKSA